MPFHSANSLLGIYHEEIIQDMNKSKDVCQPVYHEKNKTNKPGKEHKYPRMVWRWLNKLDPAIWHLTGSH